MRRGPGIKPAAIVRAAYDYQDLAGIEVLIRHFRDPSLYTWVELEAEDPLIKSLDDVVAMRQDGGVDYVQVKFTVDADQYPLDWDWLLASKTRGTSMLAKWSGALRRARTHGPIASAQLRTNRRPSPDFAACLEGGFVDLDKMSGDLRTDIEAECGGADAARAFFVSFAFVAALPDLDHYERQLRDSLLFGDTDEVGWLRLRDTVRHWATMRASPPPDGRILRAHLVQLITRKRPMPIRQDFLVPEDYVPPSGAFDTALRARAASRDTPVTVIWGTPGRGKSTYLSHLTQSLQQAGTAVIRHHYFLPDDQGSNRTSVFEIAESLFHQLASRHPDLIDLANADPNRLRDVLTDAAARLARSDVRLHLVIDGLDHVWRDTDRVDQLDQLFNLLLPLPANMVLLLGTQRVPDAQLPKRLLVEAAADSWLEIPPMDEAAVHRWVRRQDAARPLILQFEQADRREQIDAIGSALFGTSAGHPLHLIYTLEQLRLSGEPISDDRISALPACPDGDIRIYYARLWVRLSPSAREILHALAGADFFWPSEGVRQCFGLYDEVAFLVEPRPSGLRPFHASIFAWVRDLPDHGTSYRALLPRIAAWLDQEAPPYWRWGWLWLVQAQLGDDGPLLTGCTRDWAVASLAQGWPERQIGQIFAAAEDLAFERLDLPHALTLRSARSRVDDVRQFQARDFGLFRAVALTTHDNLQQAGNLLDSLTEIADGELPALMLYAPATMRAEIGQAVLTELWRRINVWLALRHRPGQDFDLLAAALLRGAARAGVEVVPRVLRFIAAYSEPHSHYSSFIDHLDDAGDLDALDAVRRHLKGPSHRQGRRLAQEAMLRAAWRAGGDPDQLLGRTRRLAPLLAARAAMLGRSVADRVEVPPAPEGLNRRRYRGEQTVRLERFFCDYFWVRVAALRSADPGLAAAFDGLDRAALGWIATGLDMLETMAQDLITGTVSASFATPFLAAASLMPVTFSNAREQDYLQYLAFRKSLLRLAIDLQHLGAEPLRRSLMPDADVEIVRGSLHWSDELWLSDTAESAVVILSPSSAGTILTTLAAELDARVCEFSERSETWTQLAAVARLHGVPDPHRWLHRAADALVGYGNRKDLTAMDALESIRAVHAVDPSQGAAWLTALVPVIEEITHFTDGDETGHIRSDLIDTLAIVMPDRLNRMHAHHLAAENWGYADECTAAAIGLIDFTGAEAAALAGTFIDPDLLTKLAARGEEAEAARALHDTQIRFLGGMPPPATVERDYTDTRKRPRKERKVTPSRYAPKRFATFLSDVEAADVYYETRPDLLRGWVDHWASRGRAREALAAVAAYLDAHDSGLRVEEMLDHCFHISLAAEGRDRAYPWLVRAHIHRSGWSRFWAGDKEVMARLETAAKHYPERWQDYVRDTSEQSLYRRRGGLWRAIGRQYLVRYLLLVGETEAALQVTDALVRIMLAEVRDQPIPEAPWFG